MLKGVICLIRYDIVHFDVLIVLWISCFFSSTPFLTGSPFTLLKAVELAHNVSEAFPVTNATTCALCMRHQHHKSDLVVFPLFQQLKILPKRWKPVRRSGLDCREKSNLYV